MALSLKERKVAGSFRKKLEQLHCPYIDGVEESWIIELVFRPGEPRIRLLQWLFAKFHSKLAELMDPHYPIAETKMDSRIQRLLIAASTMGLCRPEDADLIRGTCGVGKQTAFMEQLLDMVCIVDNTQDPVIQSMHSPGMVSGGMSLEEQFHHDCHLLDTLAAGGAQCSVDNMFNAQPKLLPPDILRHLNTVKQQAEQGDFKVPELNDLISEAEQLTVEMQKQQDKLATLRTMHPHHGAADGAQVRRVHSTLKVVLTELRQTLTGFSSCFESEMRMWCHREQPQLSEFGVICKRVHALLLHFSQLLTDLEEIQTSYRTLSDDIKKSIAKVLQQHEQQGRDGIMDMKPFRDCVDVLETSIARLDHSLNSSMRSGLTISTIAPVSSGTE